MVRDKPPVLNAEGDKQSNILRAEGDKMFPTSTRRRLSSALEKINDVAKGVDPKALTVQYFETLKNMAIGPSTKFIFPMEFTSMLGNFIKANKD